MKRAIAAAVFVCAAVSSLAASGQTLGRYLNDGSNTAWFLQITDTHITSTGLVGWYPDALPWALGECAETVNPQFIVVTGDLTDHTCGAIGNYLGPPCDEEWQAYRALLDDAGMVPDFYFDVPGNHDSYGEGALTHYLDFSMQGKETGSTQQSWRLDLPSQSLHFFSVASPANDGLQWPFDNVEFTQAELDEVKGFLVANVDAEFQMGFGHHDYLNAKKAADMEALFTQHHVNYYSHGHAHDLKLTMDGGDKILRYRIDALGQSKGNNVAIWAVDNFAVTVDVRDARSAWPRVIVTAPADGEVDWGNKVANPHNPPVPKGCTAAPVRALVFDPQSVLGVTFAIDNGAATAMAPRKSNPFQWRGTFDATGLAAGKHTITVAATASGSASSSNVFYVVDGACDLGPTDPDVAPTDGGTPDAGATADGGDAAVADTGAPDGGTVADGGTAEEDAAVADDATVGDDANVEVDTGTVEEDGGAATDDAAVADGSSPAKDGGSVTGKDAGPIMKPGDAADDLAAAAGCSCSTVGL